MSNNDFSVFDYLNTKSYIDTLRLFLIPELCEIIISYFHSFKIAELSCIEDLFYKKSFTDELYEIYYYGTIDLRHNNNSDDDGCM